MELYVAILSLIIAAFGLHYARKGPIKNSWEQTQKEFLITRKYLKGHRALLVKRSFDYYSQPSFVEDIPFLTRKEWLPQSPILLEKVKLSFTKTNPDSVLDNILRDLTRLWPYSDTCERYRMYTDAIEELDKPSLFINRLSYRLIGIDHSESIPHLSFTTCNYFDHLNVGEALAYEVAKEFRNHKENSRNSIRKKLGDPYNLSNRWVIPGIITLTIRKDASYSTFFMLQRNGLHVATGMDNYHVIPAGEFQPSSQSPESLYEDFDIWKNIMREYSEEFLGAEDYFGDAGWTTNYQSEPFISFNQAHSTGKVKCYYLGFGFDPLNLKGEILNVCVWDSDIFDLLFKEIKDEVKEGRLIAGTRKDGTLLGIPFKFEYINSYIQDKETVPAAMATLKQAWKFRKELGLN